MIFQLQSPSITHSSQWSDFYFKRSAQKSVNFTAESWDCSTRLLAAYSTYHINIKRTHTNWLSIVEISIRGAYRTPITVQLLNSIAISQQNIVLHPSAHSVLGSSICPTVQAASVDDEQGDGYRNQQQDSKNGDQCPPWNWPFPVWMMNRNASSNATKFYRSQEWPAVETAVCKQASACSIPCQWAAMAQRSLIRDTHLSAFTEGLFILQVMFPPDNQQPSF